MSLITDIAERVVGAVVERSKQRHAATVEQDAAASRLQYGLERHLAMVNKWSSHLDVFGLNSLDPLSNVDAATIGLDLSTIARRFSVMDRAGIPRNYTESDLLDGHESYVVLGEPGAGKSTTLKRIARRLLREPRVGDQISYPIVVVLREIGSVASVAALIQQALAINDTDLFLLSGDSGRVSNDNVERVRQLAAATLLDIEGGCLLVDGLDELASRTELERDLVEFERLLRLGKIIVSTRSGEYRRSFGGFAFVELCPLTRSQMGEIAESFVGERADEFFGQLSDQMLDLLDRPLSLLQMLLLFRESGVVAGHPAQLRRAILLFALRAWDEQRNLSRNSDYSQFVPEAKLRFLSALAFFLLIDRRLQRFSRDDLLKAYDQIHGNFGLPADQASGVASELETHTGIICSVHGGYEFVHLVVQEHLAADFLKTQPELSSVLSVTPGVVAIAVATSEDPTQAFISVVWHELDSTLVRPGQPERVREALIVFLGRLVEEEPQFVGSIGLGLAALRFAFEFPSEEDLLLTLFEDDIVRAATTETIGMAYRVAGGIDYTVVLEMTGEQPQDIDESLKMRMPMRAHLRRSVAIRLGVLEAPSGREARWARRHEAYGVDSQK